MAGQLAGNSYPGQAGNSYPGQAGNSYPGQAENSYPGQAGGSYPEEGKRWLVRHQPQREATPGAYQLLLNALPFDITFDMMLCKVLSSQGGSCQTSHPVVTGQVRREDYPKGTVLILVGVGACRTAPLPAPAPHRLPTGN